jgi:hypothetical protein
MDDDMPPDITYLQRILSMDDFPKSMAAFVYEFFTGPFGAMHMYRECVDKFRVLLVQEGVYYPADLKKISNAIFTKLGFSYEYTNQIREMVAYSTDIPTSGSTLFSLSHIANHEPPFLLEAAPATPPAGGGTVTSSVYPTRNVYLNSVVNMPDFPKAMVPFFLQMFVATNAGDQIARVLIDKFEALVMQLNIQTPNALLDVSEMEFQRIRISQQDYDRALTILAHMLHPDSDDPCIRNVNRTVNSDVAQKSDYTRHATATNPRSPYAYSLVKPSISKNQWDDIAHARFGMFEDSPKSIADLFFSLKGGEIVLDFDTQTCMWVCRLCGAVSGSVVCMNALPAVCLWMDPNVLLHHGRSTFHAEAMQLMNKFFIADSSMFASAPWFTCSADIYYREYMNGGLTAKPRDFLSPIGQKYCFPSRVQLLNSYAESVSVSSACCQDILG